MKTTKEKNQARFDKTMQVLTYNLDRAVKHGFKMEVKRIRTEIKEMKARLKFVNSCGYKF